jgi:dimethylglycine catabolism A
VDVGSKQEAPGRQLQVFTPVQVGPMRVPNRICETTNTIGAGRLDGLPDEPFIAHHVAKARGGTGWIGNESWMLPLPLAPGAPTEILPAGAAFPRPFHDRPDFQERMATFCDAVHAAGAVAVFQLAHSNAVFAPSSLIFSGASDAVPRELDESDIAFVIDAYAQAAQRLAECGADAVEVHGAHESLVHLFLSPATNQRTDRWGGSLQRRLRLLLEILRGVDDRIGSDLAIGVRVCGREDRAGGYGLDEMCRMVEHLVRRARVDFLCVDVGHGWGSPSYVPPSSTPPALGAPEARAIRQVSSGTPVVYVGRVRDVDAAEQLLGDGTCDLVGMTRAGIADPEFADKARAGRESEIRPCIGCNRCIANAVQGVGTGLFTRGQRAMCSVNPLVGNEGRWRSRHGVGPQPRRVVVVGGGPAGLEASRTAALRGHRVTLFEERESLGGQLRLAAQAPGRSEFLDYIRYQESQLDMLGVDVRTGARVDVEAVREVAAEVVICATGAVPLGPTFTVAGIHVCQGWDVLSGEAQPGRRVAIISHEDHAQTPSIAAFLAERDHEVSILHPRDRICAAMDRYTVGSFHQQLESRGVRVHTSRRVVQICGPRIETESTAAGGRDWLEAFDSVVLVLGAGPNDALYRRLRMEGTSQVHVIGAAWVPRQLQEATEHAMKVALDL